MHIFKKVCLIAIFLIVSSSLAFAQTVIDTIAVSHAEAIAINPETNRIYVTGTNNSGFKNFISVIDGDTNEIIDTIDIKGIIFNVAINTTTNLIYVSHVSIFSTLKPFDDVRFISVIDANTNTIIKKIGLSKVKSTSVVVNQITNKIYATGTKGFITKKMAIEVIDGDINEIVDSLNLSKGFISSSAINQETNRIYVEEILEDPEDNRKTVIGVIDGDTNNMIEAIEFGDRSTGGIVVNEETNQIYIAETKNFLSEDINDLMSVVHVIDGATNEVIDVIELDSIFIQSVGINKETNRLYAGTLKLDEAGFGSETVEIVDGESNEVVASVDVGDGDLFNGAGAPFDIAVNPVTNRIYVSIIGGLVKVIQDK